MDYLILINEYYHRKLSLNDGSKFVKTYVYY